MLETFADRQDDTSHISDYTHQPKANSNADAPKKMHANDGRMNGNNQQDMTTTTEAPTGFQLEKLGMFASSIGSLFKQAPNLIQTAVKNLPIVKQNPKIFARNVVNTDADSDNEITSDLTTAAGDTEDLESLEKSEEEDISTKTTTPTSHAPMPPPPPTKPVQPNEPPQDEGFISRLITTAKSGFYLFKAVLLPAPKHDPKAIEPPNTAFVTALENVMAFLQPILGASQPSGNRNRRDVNENQERFYSLIERTVLDRFRFDSDVQALQAKIIFRESFVRYAGIDLLSELTEERIKHLVTFFKSLNQYRNQTTTDSNEEDGAENNLLRRKTENGDINFEFFEKSATSESIFILFVEVLGTVAGLAWGTFSQFLWLISNMN